MASTDAVDDRSSAFSIFPPLPYEPYVPKQFEQRDKRVCLNESAHWETKGFSNLLQVAWAVTLSSLTNADDVLFGLVYDGPCTESGQHKILPFRLQLQAGATISNALAAAAAQLQVLTGLEQHGSEKFSGTNLKKVALKQYRNLLVLQDQKDDTSLGQSSMILPTYSKKYPLSVLCLTGSNDLRVYIYGDPAVVEPDMLDVILLQFTDVLQLALQSPNGHVRDLQALGPDGWRAMVAWNKASTDSECPLIQDMIEAQYTARESSIAVCAWDGQLTYGELNQQAFYIASFLIDDGVRPGVFVGIHMRKSKLALITMLAVIKTGGAFVFLPPSMPTARLAKMCELTKTAVVMTTAELASGARKLGPKIRKFPADLSYAAEMIPYPLYKPNPVEPLYAVFTSGSLGEPKCVVVDRQSYGPGVRKFCDATELGHGSRVYQFCSYAFVVSVFEQLVAISAGACICIPSEKQLESDIQGSLVGMDVNWAILTPSVARTLSPRAIPQLQDLLLVGEALSTADQQQWKGHLRLYGLYGQSECAASVLVANLFPPSTHRVTDLGKLNWGSCWVVDPRDHNRLQPIGTEGELMIESSALGQGYLNNPEQTAVTFVQQPTWLQQLRSNTQARCVLTGDLVRFRDLDGSIQFVGRKGNKTKIRGQRIELGEVEYHLQRHFPEANFAVADVIALSPQGRRDETSALVGFVVSNLPSKAQEAPGVDGELFAPPSPNHRQQAQQAKQELRQILPEYMVPSIIISLAYLPRTATGKCHRQKIRLAASKLSWGELMSYQWTKPSYVAPKTSEEMVLQSVCAEVLALPMSEISINDNFFNLGGDSLIARQLISKARLKGLQLSLTHVFESTTLAALAQCAHLQSQLAKMKASSLSDEGDPFRTLAISFLANLPVGLAADDIEDVIPTTEMQNMLIGAKVVDYFPFEITGPFDQHQLQQACELVVQSNASLRSIFVKFRDQNVQVILKRGPSSSFTTLDFADSDKENPITIAQARFILDQKDPLPLDKPVVHFFFCSMAKDKHAFIIRLAHAQYDGACVKPLVSQISAAYRNQPYRVAVDFPQYRRECARLRTPQALNYWKSLLAGGQVTRIPRISAEGTEGECTIYSSESRPPTPPIGVTMATAIKAAWSFVLRRKTQQQDVVFGQVADGRAMNLDGVQNTIGACLNTTPVRVDYRLTEIKTVMDLFQLIQQQHVRGLEFETLGWTDIVASCTSWPNDTNLDSVVLHENLGGLPNLDLGSATGRMLDAIFTSPGWKWHILATWPIEDSLTALMVIRAGTLEKTLAEQLLADFNQTLVKFLNFPAARLDEV